MSEKRSLKRLKTLKKIAKSSTKQGLTLGESVLAGGAPLEVALISARHLRNALTAIGLQQIEERRSPVIPHVEETPALKE